MKQSEAHIEPALKSLAIEARAKIIWGNSPEDIRYWLATKNLSATQINTIVDFSIRERASSIRSLGLRDLVYGGLISAAGSVVLFLSLKYVVYKYTGRLMGFAVAAVLYGLWRIVRGIDRIIFGARIHGSVADLNG